MPKSPATATWPGQRALHASGQGYWELDVRDGTAWFSPWIHTGLGWAPDAEHSRLSAWRPYLSPADWSQLLYSLRTALERNAVLDLELEFRLPDAQVRRWRLKGAAQRGQGHLPDYLAGSIRDVTEERRLPPASRTRALGRLELGFDALPVPAALIDAVGIIHAANRRWREHAADTALLGAAFGPGANFFRVCAANAETHPAAARVQAGLQALITQARPGPGLTLDYRASTPHGAATLRLRAEAFLHEGGTELAVTQDELPDPTDPSRQD